MVDRSSRPVSSPHRTPTRRERRIVGLRVSRRWGPARIAYRARDGGLHGAQGLASLRLPAAGLDRPGDRGPDQVGRRRVHPYVHDAPGDLVHVDIKKLGRIPDGGGGGSWAEPMATAARAIRWGTGTSTTPSMTAPGSPTASFSTTKARRPPRASGPGRTPTSSPSGSPSASAHRQRRLLPLQAFAHALGEAITHKRTRPYRPQTNGKVERFNRTTLEEWAYARPYSSETERTALFNDWLHTYNHHRGHTALGGKSPADLVPNLRGQKHLGQ